jgi:L-ascorbate metabolism protein UlaG (beta-lactamase superfamily)
MIEAEQRDEGLLADVRAAAAVPGALHVWWLGQSGFLLQSGGRHLLLDPYLSDSLTRKYAGTDKPHVRMTERVIDPARLDFIDVVTSSHQHTDHLDGETLRALFAVNAGLRMISPAAHRALVTERAGLPAGDPAVIDLDDGVSAEVAGISFTGIASAHETLETDEEGRHRFLGYLIRIGPWTIYHPGDTVDYPGLAERLRQEEIDLAFLPINGRLAERRVAGNLDGPEAARLAKAAGIGCVVPCHYDMFEFNTASPAGFEAECARLGQRCRVMRAGGRWSIGHSPSPQF